MQSALGLNSVRRGIDARSGSALPQPHQDASGNEERGHQSDNTHHDATTDAERFAGMQRAQPCQKSIRRRARGRVNVPLNYAGTRIDQNRRAAAAVL
jgi:hypothetical protein